MSMHGGQQAGLHSILCDQCWINTTLGSQGKGVQEWGGGQTQGATSCYIPRGVQMDNN